MLIKFQQYQIKINENPEDLRSFGDQHPSLKNVADLVYNWNRGAEEFTFFTSGSTGSPKKMIIDRERIKYSAEQTFNKIDPKGAFKSTLLCINPQFIGGAMVVFRALIRNLDLTVVPTSSTFMENIAPDESFDLASMVPMQFQSLSESQINQFGCILIGGAPSSANPPKHIKAAVYTTYGMTETVSHIALKPLKGDYYETLGDSQIAVDDREALKIKGTITHHQWLQTNDMVELRNSNQFKWMGRVDHMINSGGIKLNPEDIEKKLSSQITTPFFVTSLPDETLGEKVVLVLEGTTVTAPNFRALDKYQIPKAILTLQQFVYTDSGKIDRAKTRALL